MKSLIETLGLNLNQHRYSFNLLLIFISSIFLWIFVTINRFIQRIHRLPKGPWGLPIVGYLPFIKHDKYLQFVQLSKKYGPVFSLKLGQHDVVILNDWPSVREAFTKEELLARPNQTFFPEIIPYKSFSEMDVPEWHEHRHVAMRALRDAGWGKSVVEDMIVEEITQFLQVLDKYADQGEKCDLDGLLGPSIANNIASLLFGHRFDYNDPEKITLDNNFDTFTKIVQFAGISIFLPLLGKIVGKLGLMNYAEAKKCFNGNNDYFSKEIERHLKHARENCDEPARDYIDGYLKEKHVREARAQGDSKDVQLFDIETLKMNLGVFFVGGSETAKATLCWAILFLLKYPEYQDRIHGEIFSAFGADRNPCYEDRGLLPFTMAFLNETSRYGSVVAISVLRRASRDVEINSQIIPKDTIVIFNFYAVHHDPGLWKNPEEFDPDRFLTEDGSKVTKPPYLVPFIGGKRICPGEGLANIELFLYFTLILQRYRIKSAEDTEIKTEADFGLTRRPKYFPMLILEKNQ